MKSARKIDRARRRAEEQIERLEALRLCSRLTPEAFFHAAPLIREYLAAVEAERGRAPEVSPGREGDLRRVLARTRALAETLGLAGIWDETMSDREESPR